ncbi:hypothetical protein [Deinococcus sp. NW-56]|uniref:hypothetical protein n=1 Tax=Deinococcus sp. NW-56 TaxID=2080419 RepID=UPI001319B867|nr:hypothetical protein [Deinococcus sp. NW-56]
MKRLTFAALGSALLLASCNQAQTQPPVTVDPATSGVITFTLKPAAAPQGLSGQALPTPTNVRVLVSNPTTGFKVIKDVAVGTGSATVEARVPARDGYKVEAFSYLIKSQYDKRVLKDGLAGNITVAAGQTTQINMTLQPIVMSIKIPTTVTAGEKFTATYDQPRSLHPQVYFRLSAKPFIKDEVVDMSLSGGSYKSSFEMNAPASETNATMYIQAMRWIDERFVQPGESYTNFLYYAPSVDNGDAPVTATLTVPEGGIGIGIGY